MLAAGLCFVLNACGPEGARQTWAIVKQALEETIMFRGAKPNGLAAIAGAEPKNELEAMLVEQMTAAHALAMDEIGRTRRSENLAQYQSYGSLAVKLMRVFALQTEAYAKLKRGGEQMVRVEHVHVHQGGQAIVGNVNAPAEGVGAHEKVGGQPHALGYAPGVEMPRQIEAQREAMPVARGEGV
jgi:hypothetical protein